MTLGTAFQGRENNLGLLRFTAALAVILSHAFSLVTGEPDFVSRATDGQATLGQLAVLLFFFYGGLLIMKSMESKKMAAAFFRARCLRIFPALWIVVLLCAFILGPAMTEVSAGDYFRSGETWKYLLNCLLIPVYPLPGVFSEHVNTAVNGSLWTLPVEFICYILCFLFYKLGLAEKKKALLILPPVALGAFAAWKALAGNGPLQSAVLPVLFFYLGMLAWLTRDRIPLRGYGAAAATAVLAAAVVLKVYTVAVCLTYPYILLYIGFGTRRKLSAFGRKHELSYAVYLTGFPLQQTLIAFFPAMEPWANFLAAACLAVLASLPVTWLERRTAARIK